MKDDDVEPSGSPTEPARALIDALADALDPEVRTRRRDRSSNANVDGKLPSANHRRLVAGLIRVLVKHVRHGENYMLKGSYKDFLRCLLGLPKPPSHHDRYGSATPLQTGHISTMVSRVRDVAEGPDKGVFAWKLSMARAQFTVYLDATDADKHDAIFWIGVRDQTGAVVLADDEPTQCVPLPGIPEGRHSPVTLDVSQTAAVPAPTERGFDSPAAVPSARRNYLRPPTLDFLGRDELLEHLATLATQDDRAIIGLHGMGGLGKTEIALALGQRLGPKFPDAQLFIEMPGADDHEAHRNVLLRLLTQLGAPAPLPTESLAGEFYRLANPQRGLVLFDDALGPHTFGDLQPPPGWLFIITTRHQFGLAGAQWPRIPGLAPRDARALLLKIAGRTPPPLSRDQMAAARRTPFGGHDEMRDFADLIVHLCGFLPLAICIAGTFLQLHPDVGLEEYAQLLADEGTCLDALDGDDESKSIRAVFNISYQRIAPSSRALFAEVGIFEGAFTVSAARAVCPAFSDKAFAELRRQALMEYIEPQQRFRLHDLLRVYAREHLATDAEICDAVTRRHAEHFGTRAQEILACYYSALMAYKTTGWRAHSPSPDPENEHAFKDAEAQSVAEAADVLQGAHWVIAEQTRASANIVTPLFRQYVEALVVDNLYWWSPFDELDTTFLKRAAIPYANDVSMQPFRAWLAFAEGSKKPFHFEEARAHLEKGRALATDRPLLQMQCAEMLRAVCREAGNLPGLRDALSAAIGMKERLGHEDMERLGYARLLIAILIHQGRYDEAAQRCRGLQEVDDVIRQQGRKTYTADTTSMLGRVQLESAVGDFGEGWFRTAEDEIRESRLDSQNELIKNSAFLALARAMKRDGTAVEEVLWRFRENDRSRGTRPRLGLMTAEVAVGRAMILLDQHERAIAAFDEALANQPSDVVERALYPAIARFYRAQANAALGHRNEAVEDLRVAAPILTVQESPLAADAHRRLYEVEAVR